MRRLGLSIALSILAVVFLVNDAAADKRQGRRHGIKRHHKYKSQRHHRARQHRKWHRRHRRPRTIVRHNFWIGPSYVSPVWYGYPVYTGPRVIYRSYPRERYVYSSPDYGCASYVAGNDNEVLGSVIGAIGGGVIGHQVGRGSGQALATFAGVLLGSVVGGQIGRDLDEAERLKLASTTQYALENQRSARAPCGTTPTGGCAASWFPGRHSRTNSTSIAGSSSRRLSSTAKSRAPTAPPAGNPTGSGRSPTRQPTPET